MNRSLSLPSCACFKGLKTHDRDYHCFYWTVFFRKFLSSHFEKLTKDANFDINNFRISLKVCQTFAHVCSLIVPRINQYRTKHLKDLEGSEISLRREKNSFPQLEIVQTSEV